MSERMQAIGVITLFFCFSPWVKASGFVPISGGQSPKGNLSIVVKSDEDTSQDTISMGNEHPYLKNTATGKIIGPLEEVDTDGGGFGHVLENVTAYWSPDGWSVAIRFRAGRLSEDFVVYRIERHGAGYQAVPQKLPDATSGPNGAKIFAHASHAANMGDIFTQWLSSSEFAIQKYRFFPPYPPESADVDFFNGDGLIEVDYSYGANGWRVSSYKKPPESATN